MKPADINISLLLLLPLLLFALPTSAQTNITKLNPTNRPAPPAVYAPVVSAPARIRVLSTQATGLQKCQTDKGEMIILGLPPTVVQAVAQHGQLQAQAANLEARHLDVSRTAREADAVAPTYAYGSRVYVDRQMAKRDRANLLKADAETTEANLKVLEKKLTQSEKDLPKKTTVMAVETAQVYAGTKVWRYVGMAPHEKEQPVEQSSVAFER